MAVATRMILGGVACSIGRGAGGVALSICLIRRTSGGVVTVVTDHLVGGVAA